MKILLTNDDGVHAPGLATLKDCVRRLVDESTAIAQAEIWVVAPDRNRSECGHSVESSNPLKLIEVEKNTYGVTGTPVDCIRVAFHALDIRPDVVFSGINAGANLGVNLMVSGTFAAAREASILGVPAVALSHYRRPDVERSWTHAYEWTRETLGEFLSLAMNRDAENNRHDVPLWNVNLPAVRPAQGVIPSRVVCDVDRMPITRRGKIDQANQIQFELDFHGRPRESGSDVDHCFGGKITLSKLSPSLKHR